MMTSTNMELAARAKALEDAGLMYVENVQIDFPPQVKASTGRDGLIVPIRDILLWLAQEDDTRDPSNAAELRQIADSYYPADGDALEEIADG